MRLSIRATQLLHNELIVSMPLPISNWCLHVEYAAQLMKILWSLICSQTPALNDTLLRQRQHVVVWVARLFPLSLASISTQYPTVLTWQRVRRLSCKFRMVRKPDFFITYFKKTAVLIRWLSSDISIYVSGKLCLVWNCEIELFCCRLHFVVFFQPFYCF